jgi:hypothetical protein
MPLGPPLFPAQVVTSGQFNFNPSNNEIIAHAFARIGVRRTEILTDHIRNAVMELNALFSRMNNSGPNLWTVDLQSIPLIQGVATYSVPAETIQILDVFIRTGSGASTIDTIMYPLSRTEYASLSNKNSQGKPSQFWFDRLISPTITFYLTPDGNGPYDVFYYRYRQIQDSLIANGQVAEIPNRWIDAVIAGLAYRMARIYAPQLEQVRKADADDAWSNAATQDVENVPLNIIPGLAGYWRL